jgi:plastocyanin
MRTPNAAHGLTSTAIALTCALTLAACGGDNGGSGPGGPSNPGTVAATVTITATGVSPADVTVPAGSRVTWVNNDTRPHEPASNPHPTHGSCPPIDQVGQIQPGQNRTSGNFNTAGTCNYHDHLFDTNPSYNGVVRVQ